MKSLNFALATFALLVASSAAKSQATLKSFLQTESESEIDSFTPQEFGFQGCNFTFNNTPPGNPPGTPPGDVCTCTLSNMTGTMPALGQATYYNNFVNMVASTGAANISTPDNLKTEVVAVQTCACENAVFSSNKALVKTNNFAFGGRIDVVEAAQSTSTSSSSALSTGYGQKQATTLY